jgi:hypothetical protein
MRPLSRCLALAVLCLAGCLLPGRDRPASSSDAGFFDDYALLKPSGLVGRAYVNPAVDRQKMQSVRILDFANYSGKDVDPHALTLLADSVTAEIEARPPGRRPFQLIDRSPRGASNWVDAVLECAVTTYDVRSDTSSHSRMSQQVVVGIECKLLEAQSGAVVMLLQDRVKEKLSETAYDNPVREAMRKLSRKAVDFLYAPDVDPGRPA